MAEEQDAPAAQPQPAAGGNDNKSRDRTIYVVLGLLFIAGIYLYLSYKGYVPKLF